MLASTVVPAVLYFIFYVMVQAVGNVLTGYEYVAAGPVFGGVVGTVLGYAAITGSVLVWLLQRTVTQEPSLPQGAA